MLFTKNRNFYDILRVDSGWHAWNYGCPVVSELWLSVCDVSIPNTTHSEVVWTWVVLSDLQSHCLPPGIATIWLYGVCVSSWPRDTRCRKVTSDNSSLEIQVSHSELESIKIAIIQHFFLFSGDDILNRGEPQTGKISINNLKEVLESKSIWKSECGQWQGNG